MKTKKSITLEIPLPMNSLHHIENTATFKRYLTDAASRVMKKTCDEAWIAKVYLDYLQVMEKERRKAFKQRIAEFRSKTDSENATSKKAPVATDRRTAEVDEG